MRVSGLDNPPSRIFVQNFELPTRPKQGLDRRKTSYTWLGPPSNETTTRVNTLYSPEEEVEDIKGRAIGMVDIGVVAKRDKPESHAQSSAASSRGNLGEDMTANQQKLIGNNCKKGDKTEKW